MAVSENSVPLNPMVNDHYPYIKWLFHWGYTPFSDKPKCVLLDMICCWCIIIFPFKQTPKFVLGAYPWLLGFTPGRQCLCHESRPGQTEIQPRGVVWCMHPFFHPSIHTFIHHHPSIHPSIHPYIHTYIHALVSEAKRFEQISLWIYKSTT